ncbi:antiviral reverse transcriptase Drt3b [Asticcacaulis benevestitus]|uniref:Reverse transcriptase domain-containing protein n=1 Tax=Asticcacaulis benevestitus DSM 16100 = ATCC BAA-896 TaxID=1121022 RepID=V4PMF0_9CAUL|nr:antiviral reverse transcriptase Drt3b [Asticcacaulis benevestitus]ESQ86625.1 hypothetical protein ABENE_18130 [Asticcacaulis benevestitus DSM 16100 = ATCC BAA-896]
MQRKKVRLKYKKERAILSDVLPFEVPITFSNRNYYQFITDNKIYFEGDKLYWKAGLPVLDRVVHLLFGLPTLPALVTTVGVNFGPTVVQMNVYNCGSKEVKKDTIPFDFKISHKLNEYRTLAVPHPRNQIQVVDFYHRYKEFILYLCTRSAYSIRRPERIAKFRYHKDKTHYNNLADDVAALEEHDKEYEDLKSFFVYKDHSNIYKFYESYKYHRSEKKYNKLLKLDISKCFDSIYTHSIEWAVAGKPITKENLSKSKGSFGSRFDSLMQSMNYNETNGIIIGPELSRVFAEIILQDVDTQLEKCLKEENLIHKVDYEIFRYLDDYFLFYNSEGEKDKIVGNLHVLLKEYKLSLNSAKAVLYDKPLITEITRAKDRIGDLLSDALTFDIKVPDEEDAEPTGSIYINSKSLITKFKTVVKECTVEYKDILNYSLAIVERKSDKILKSYSSLTEENRNSWQLTKAVIGILEFLFFIYSVSPRVNTTIKLCRILRMFIEFFGSKFTTHDHKHLIYKYIFDECSFAMKNASRDDITQVETLYLLIVVSNLGKEYWIDEKTLATYLNVSEVNGSFQFRVRPNYFTITVALFYMSEKVRYAKLREFLEDEIFDQLASKKNLLARSAEATMLLFDVISCPFISAPTKTKVLSLFGVIAPAEQANIIDFRAQNGDKQMWFTSWDDFDLGKALDAKRSQEVY